MKQLSGCGVSVPGEECCVGAAPVHLVISTVTKRTVKTLSQTKLK